MIDIKAHPYLRQGMNEGDYKSWMNDDFDIIKITDEDVKNAISIPGLIKRGIKNFKNRFFRSNNRSASMPSICILIF